MSRVFALLIVGAIVMLLATYPSDQVSLPKLESFLVTKFSSESEHPQPDLRMALLRDRTAPDERLVAGPLVPELEIDLARFQRPRSQGNTPGPLGELLSLFHGSGADPFLEARGWSGEVIADDRFDKLPELKKVRGLIPRGIDPPLVAGFNPCAEQSLAPFETCCLAEVFLPNIETK